MTEQNDVFVLFTKGMYDAFLRAAVRAELIAPTPELLSLVFAANVALWNLTDARMCVSRMQRDGKLFLELIQLLETCAFKSALDSANQFSSHIARAIQIGIVGKAMSVYRGDAATVGAYLSIPIELVLGTHHLFEKAHTAGWGSRAPTELPRVSAFIQV